MPANELSQILWNLLTNALQAVSEKGRIRLHGQAAHGRPFSGWGGDPDRGRRPRIPEDQLKRIFEPFFTTKEKGLGLGLSIVQKLVSQHQGIIKVKAPPKAGPSLSWFFPHPREKALTAAD